MGDQFRAQFTLRNTTARKMQVVVTPHAGSLDLPPKTVEMGPNSSAEVLWDVTAPDAVGMAAAGALAWQVSAAEQGGARAADAVKLTQRVESVDVDVFARPSGDFPVIISVRSPEGGLVIPQAQFTVRSLSTSIVAIVLSAVAVAVLLLWWGRSPWGEVPLAELWLPSRRPLAERAALSRVRLIR